MNQLHSKMICDENFGAQTQFIKMHDMMIPEELARSGIREGTDSANNGAYMMNPSAMSKWTEHLGRYLKCGSTVADLEFQKLDIHYAGVRTANTHPGPPCKP